MTAMRFALILLTALIISILAFCYCLMQIILYIIQQGYLPDSAALIGAYLLGVISPVVLYMKFTNTPPIENTVFNTAASGMLGMFR